MKCSILLLSAKWVSKVPIVQVPVYANYFFLKLVLLEWSESKSDGKFGFSMLKNPYVQIFRAIGATSGV